MFFWLFKPRKIIFIKTLNVIYILATADAIFTVLLLLFNEFCIELSSWSSLQKGTEYFVELKNWIEIVLGNELRNVKLMYKNHTYVES